MIIEQIELSQYKKILHEVEQTILLAQKDFIENTNAASIVLYLKLGELLANTTEKYQWGQKVFSHLAHDLVKMFSNARGYSEGNLRRMRQFYLEYVNFPDLLELVKKVRWSTNISIIHKVKQPEARKFYLQMASDSMCSRDIIELQIKSQAYEREHLTNKTHNFKKTLPLELAATAENILKPSYFLEVCEPFSGHGKILEKHIENHMIEHIKKVIMMLGKGFAFIGNQYRIEAKGNEYFIDLLFFNRIIKSLFCVEIKAKKLKAEYAGKMNLYLSLLDDYVKQPDENPSIGLILCTDKNAFEAEYALRDINKPIGVSEMVLSKVLPANLADKLPDLELLKDEILLDLAEVEG